MNNPERWQHIEQLYHSALQCDPEERSAFLDQACAGDEKLRREVESLLAYQDQSEDFIESPALEFAAKLVAEEQSTLVAVGQTINQYQITSRLGAGGMGEVFLALDTRLNRKVAIKFLPALFTGNKTHLNRFEQEARAVAALSHPHVCVIHEVIETNDGRHCIVMEYVDGATLRARMEKSSIDIREALDIAIQSASALSAAHTEGVVHRDIKPENVMIRNDGYVKILDFGLAKLTSRDASLLDTEEATILRTTPGIVLGTVFYMSPEQARGLPVDPRTDIWSVGVVLYEMLAGKKPFDGPTPTDVIIAIAERNPEPLSNQVRNIPASVEKIVTKALAKDRAARYQSAEELLGDLRKAKHELEVGAQHVPGQKPPLDSTSEDKSITSRSLLSRKGLLWAAGIAGVLIIAVLTYSLLASRVATTPPIEIKSIAVLPLDNLSGDKSQDYFADGMTDALITDLAKISALRVISRPSVMQYKGVRKSLPEIGRELKVDAVLTGSVVRAGERVRVGVQLTQAATEQNLWANSYERDLRDVLTLQSEVTRDIVSKIKIQLTGKDQGRAQKSGSVNPQAYDQYLRGRFYLDHQTKEDNDAAITAFENAISIDPNFAEAQAELAQAYVWRLFLFAPNEKQWEEKAFVSLEKALSLNPDLAEAHLARGRLLWTPANHFQHDQAIREYRRALDLDPSLDEARNQLALVYSHVGLLDEALRELETGIAVNPTNSQARFRVGEVYLFQGRNEESLNTLRNLPAEVNPSLIGHQIVLALFNLGRKDEASATLDKFLKDYPDDNRGLFTSLQAVLSASNGNEHLAEEQIRLAIQKGKGFGHFHHTEYHIACAYALMKKTDQAIKWLETAASDGFPCYLLFEKDPKLNSLRQDARFAAFLEKTKKEWESYKSISF